MGSPKGNRKRKRKIKLKNGARVQKKGGTKNSYPQAPTRLAGDNGANIRIKIRRKQ